MLLLALLLTQDLHSGMVITRSMTVTPKTYRVSGVTVRGDNITVDFRGATLQGSASDTAIRIDGGRNVRILNARVRGYKVGILARGTQRLTLAGNELSHNWRPRLYSLVEHESLVDWLSFHHNEKDEWLRFGAAIYLVDVTGGELRRNTALGGMNGALLVRTDSVEIRDNNFSFNSGLGIGLYRSSDNTITNNRLDYNVRGYSHGFFSRGQDSAGLLIYEQSCRNIVTHNSLTHGGDGIFLWAGQTTMDSGTGGANDNLFYGNDVSYATANGIEATFSRNSIIANRAWGSEYGIWAGYSFATTIIGNDFRRNRTGIAIEHGQDNIIKANRFAHDSTAIRLWADSIEPSDWGYPKHRDTRSRDYRIKANVFLGSGVKLNARNTTGLAVDSTDAPDTSSVLRIPPLPSSPLSLRDRSAIIVDEWGPYDWRSPKLWPVDSTRAIPLRLAVLGPPGSWRVVSKRGVAALSQVAGRIGDTIAVTPKPDSLGFWKVSLRHGSGATFSYERFEPPIPWEVRFFTWKDTSNFFETPISSADPGAAPRGLSRLDLMWYRPSKAFADLPQEKWSLRATGSVDLAPGTYTLRVISDDAIRVWIDDSLVIDHWGPHESAVDTAPISPGRHQLRVEYYQKDGWVELRVEIVRGTERPSGSPGPH